MLHYLLSGHSPCCYALAGGVIGAVALPVPRAVGQSDNFKYIIPVTSIEPALGRRHQYLDACGPFRPHTIW
jgi:hypothetical protein